MEDGGAVFKVLFLIRLSVHLSSAGTHSLQYLHTAVTPGIHFPEFIAIGLVDEEQFMYYDSNIRTIIPKTEWIQKIDDDDPDYWMMSWHVRHQQDRLQDTLASAMQNFNQPEVRPEVSVFQKHSPSPEVVCHATGFFPKALNIRWQKYVYEDMYMNVYWDVALRETLPNQDGSFQRRSILKVSAEELQNNNYTCVIQHSSLEKDLVLPVRGGGGALIANIFIALSVLLALVFLISFIAVIVNAGCLIYKKKKKKKMTKKNTNEEEKKSDINLRALTVRSDDCTSVEAECEL